MNELLEGVKTWSPILIPILSLLAGGGWLQYYLALRDKKQEKYRIVLDDFLQPFKGSLALTSRKFESLQDDRVLTNLEFHPGRLQQFYASLPEDDPRKYLWKARIDALQEENQRGLDLVNKYYGRITTADFRKACDEYKFHVSEWNLVWKHLIDSQDLPGSLNISGALFAPKFPENLEKALEAEIAVVIKLVR